MTPAQESAIEQVKHIMREHFDGAIFVCVAERGDDEDEHVYDYCGGLSRALGLYEIGKHRLLAYNLKDESDE